MFHLSVRLVVFLSVLPGSDGCFCFWPAWWKGQHGTDFGPRSLMRLLPHQWQKHKTRGIISLQKNVVLSPFVWGKVALFQQPRVFFLPMFLCTFLKRVTEMAKSGNVICKEALFFRGFGRGRREQWRGTLCSCNGAASTEFCWGLCLQITVMLCFNHSKYKLNWKRLLQLARLDFPLSLQPHAWILHFHK